MSDAPQTDPRRLDAARQQAARAEQAYAQNNLTLAADLYGQAVKVAPGELQFRRRLREIVCEIHGNTGEGPRMGGLGSAGTWAQLKLARTRGKWQDAVNLADELLRANPWDAAALYELAYALNQQGHNITAIWVLTETNKCKNKRIENYRLLAELLKAAGRFKDAIVALEWVRRLDPNDTKVATEIRRLSASETIQQGFSPEGEDGDQTGRVAVKQAHAGESVIVKTNSLERARTEIEELVSQLRDDPNNPEVLRAIGERYKMLGNFKLALQAFEKALERRGPTDLPLRIQIAECRLELHRQQIEQAKIYAYGTPTDELDAAKRRQALEDITRAEAELPKHELEFYLLRLEWQPDDREAHFEVGRLYLQVHKVDDAIKHLQRARTLATVEVRCMYLLGLAFWEKRNYTLARSQLRNALARVPENDKHTRMDVLYHLGRVCQDAGDPEAALQYFNELAELEYGFRDVSERLDELNNMLA